MLNKMVVLPGATTMDNSKQKLGIKGEMGNFGFKNVSKRNNIDLMEYFAMD